MDAKLTGRFIAGLRKERGLTQGELAAELNVTNKAVSRWETGAGFPDVDSMMALSEFFGVSVNELLLGRRSAPAGPGGEEAAPPSEAEQNKKELAQIACESLDLSIKKRRFSRAAKILAAALAVVLALSAVLIVTGRREKPIEPPVTETPVVFSDPHVESAVRTELGRAEGELFPSELKRVTSISLCDARIDDLSDLEKLPGLISLALTNVELNDPSPIGRLRSLNYLIAEEVGFPDISFLSGLDRLHQLILRYDGITDISPLAGLTELRVLYLDGNGIGDLSPLFGLKELNKVSLSWNPVSKAQAEALAEALGAEIVCQTPWDDGMMRFPMDIDGDGEDEYLIVDIGLLAAGEAASCMLTDGGGSAVAALADIGTGQEGYRITYARVFDPDLGECLLKAGSEGSGEISWSLLRLEDGRLTAAEHGDMNSLRLHELLKSGTLLISTDAEGMLKSGLYRADTGEALDTLGAAGVLCLSAGSVNGEGLPARLEAAGFIVADAPIWVSFGLPID